MLTDDQRLLFTKILDLNYDINREHSNTKKFELFERLNAAKTELRNSMGADAYNEFMNKGQRMFAPATN